MTIEEAEEIIRNGQKSGIIRPKSLAWSDRNSQEQTCPGYLKCQVSLPCLEGLNTFPLQMKWIFSDFTGIAY